MEQGVAPREAAEKGGMEVALAVLAATSTTSIVFFPVSFFYGVSRYLFADLALGVVISIFASYIFAMTVVPLYCAYFIRLDAHGEESHENPKSWLSKVVHKFNEFFQRLLNYYEGKVTSALERPGRTAIYILAFIVVLFAVLFPFVGRAYFPRTDPGQFVINVKAPSGTRLEVSDKYIAQVERDIRSVIPKSDLEMIVSNIGITPDLSAIYTSNSAMDTAFVQINLREHHKVGSYEYMERVREKLASDLPQLSIYLQAGGLVDSVVNQGLPAPLDIQVSDNNLDEGYSIARNLALQLKGSKLVSDVLIPQAIDFPGLELNIDRQQASLLGLTPRDVVDNVITALTSDGMIAPSYWIDPKTGNNYMLTVQYSNEKVGNMTMTDFRNIPLRAPKNASYTPLAVSCQNRADQHSHRSRSLPNPARRRYLRHASH